MITNPYEGYIPGRIGFNFPTRLVNELYPISDMAQYDAAYVTVYKKETLIRSVMKHNIPNMIWTLPSRKTFRYYVIRRPNTFRRRLVLPYGE